MKKSTFLFLILVSISVNAVVIFPDLNNMDTCITQYSVNHNSLSKDSGSISISCINEKNKIKKFEIKETIDLGDPIFARLRLFKEMTKMQMFKLDSCFNGKLSKHVCYFSKSIK